MINLGECNPKAFRDSNHDQLSEKQIFMYVWTFYAYKTDFDSKFSCFRESTCVTCYHSIHLSNTTEPFGAFQVLWRILIWFVYFS